ncbi:MAG: ATP-binding protein [Planctomycetota bacterium]
MTTLKTNEELSAEIERLQLRLEESEAVVEAIRSGIVDAVVVSSQPGECVYTLEGADRPYRLLIEAMPQGVALLNSDGVLLYCNPGLADLLQLPLDQVTGRSLDGFVAPADQTIWTEMFSSVTGTAAQNEVQLHRVDGTIFPASLALSVLPLNKFCLLVTDLSQQKQYEELIKSKAALLDLDRRKDEFLAMLGHELRNPLAPISNAIQLLRLQKNEDKIQQNARTIIERQVGQLTRLIDDLLEVSRITSGTIHLQQERVTLNRIMERAVETTRPLIDQHCHQLSMVPSLEQIELYVDAARMEQVIVNRLNNAAKYTADGGQISITIQQEGNEGVLRVKDTGVGIAPALLPRIFELFTQAERSLARSQGGLGIGLCVVQRLVEMHGGRVDVESTLGAGSEFVIRLPILSTTPSPPPAPTMEKIAPKGRSLRVLVVDDNIDAAQTLELLLTELGHDVRTAYDGLSVLQIAIDHPPDIVLLDLGLPGLDGFEVAKRLRQHPALKNVVLVAMTGYGLPADRQRSQDAGFNHHLVKPASFDKLQQILASIIESPPGTR